MRHFAFIIFAAFGVLSSLVAQQPAMAPVPVAPTKPDSDKQIVRERERTIYVPYDEIEKVFNDGGKGVFLPYREFLDLWNELNLKRKQDEVKPPQDGVVTKADYTARVEGETLVIDAVVSVESFKKGWLVLPLADKPLAGLAESETGSAVLRARSDGYDVILPDKGKYELKLKMYAPITRSGGKSRTILTLPKAAVSRLTATVPGKGLEFEVTPAAAFTARDSGADATEFSFFAGSGGQFGVIWSKKEAATELKPLVLASGSVSAEVRAGSLATKAVLDFRILRAPVASFNFLIPSGQEVLGILGDDVKDWKLEAAGAQQKLTVNPNAPVKDKWHIEIALEAPLPKLPAEVVVPEIIVEGAAQDRGEINIAAEQQLDVTPKPGEGLVQQTQAAAAAQGLAAVGGYRFLKHPAKLALAIAEAKPQVNVDSLSVLTVKRDSNRVETTFNYNIRRVGTFEARVALPTGWTNWEVVGLSPDQWSVEKDGAGESLAVKFNKQILGQVSFAIRAQQQRANATEDAVVPVFAPQNVVRYEAKIGVGVPFGLELNTKINGDLHLDDVNMIGSVLQLSGGNTYSGATFINSGTVLQPSKMNQLADTELTVAFRHRDAVKTSATLSFKARDPQVNVEVLTLVEAKEQSLRHSWTLVFDVAYAGTDRFVLAVPKSIAADIRFVDANVKERNKDYKADDKLLKMLPDAQNFDLWEVVLKSEKLGAFSLNLSVEKPLPTEKDAKLEMLSVHVPGAFQEVGQVAVVKDDALEIRKYEPENLEEIDPSELHGGLARSGVFLAFKSRTQPVKLALTVAKNAYIAVPQVVITHAALTTAVATDRAQTTEAVYWVRNNGQQFLTVQLPKGARLVSDIFVNGATQQPMKRVGAEDLLVRLPGGQGHGATGFPVRFVYEMPSPKAGEKMGRTGSFTIEPPKLTDVSVVLETHAQLYLPERYDYTSFEGAMTQSVADRGWGKLHGIFDPLIPSFGPQLDAPVEQWNPVPAIPASQKAPFDFKVPHQGQSAKLHRLGAPATIEVTFRTRTMSFVMKSAAFLLVVLLGLFWLTRSLASKVVFAGVVSLCAVVSTGLLSAANGAVAQAAVLGVLAIMGVWFVFAVPAILRALMNMEFKFHRFMLALLLGLVVLMVLAVIVDAGRISQGIFVVIIGTVIFWIVASIVRQVRGSRNKPPAIYVAPQPVVVPVQKTVVTPPSAKVTEEPIIKPTVKPETPDDLEFPNIGTDEPEKK